jgi:hypothetical protein
MVASGAKTSDIARDIGISRTTVRVWAQEEGISRLSHIEAIKANSLMRKLKGAEIPHWVPSDLRGEFVEWVAEADEFEAAAHIREIKRARREERAS